MGCLFERGWEGPLRIALYMIRENTSAIVQGDFVSVSAVLREACANAPMDIASRSLALTFNEDDQSIIDAVTNW